MTFSREAVRSMLLCTESYATLSNISQWKSSYSLSKTSYLQSVIEGNNYYSSFKYLGYGYIQSFYNSDFIQYGSQCYLYSWPACRKFICLTRQEDRKGRVFSRFVRIDGEECNLVIQYNSQSMINQKQQLFPFCIVWTILPCITWFIPCIGHAGICDSAGNIYDFLGYHINTGSMAFGNVVKYVRIYPESDENFDDGVAQANLKFKHENHNLCCNNCHHHVAYALNAMKYQGRDDWTQMDIWWLCITRSNYVNWCGVLRVYLPFLIVVGLVIGLVFGLKS